MTFNPNSNKETSTSSPPSIDNHNSSNSSSDECHQQQNNSTNTIMPPLLRLQVVNDDVDDISDAQQQQLTANFKQINISSESGQGAVRMGKCKWFNVAKGWGFITPNDGGQEVFVHQSVIQMAGFRSLAEQESLEFECKATARGLEAIRVSGVNSKDCVGSTFRPRPKKRFRRVRCYNCGQFANHIASKCALGPQPKRCHNCKSEDHLVADCPNACKS